MDGKEPNLLLLFLGIILTIWSIIEALWTTIWANKNASPFTSRFNSLLWKAFRSFVKPGKNGLLNLAGPVILFLSVTSWILLLWLGWVLVFYAIPGAALVKSSNSIPDFTDLVWFISYCIFTVGNGDLTPSDGLWQVVSSFVAFSGMGMVTLAITYVLQVVSAVVDKRAFASEVNSIGKTAVEFVEREWTGKDFGAIELQLNSFSSELSKLSQQHMAFPILHYYHSGNISTSLARALAVLYDAILLIEMGVEKKHQPSESILLSSRKSAEIFLQTLKGAFIKPASETPEKPDLGSLKEKGIPVVPEEEFNRKLKATIQSRKLILGLIRQNAWHWPS